MTPPPPPLLSFQEVQAAMQAQLGGMVWQLTILAAERDKLKAELARMSQPEKDTP